MLGAIGANYAYEGSVYTTTESSVGLPSTLWLFQAASTLIFTFNIFIVVRVQINKRITKTELFEILKRRRFSMDGKHFENEAFRKR